MIRNVDTTIAVNKKFVPKYRGPYVIHRVLQNDRYIIRDVDNCQITQIPYNGVLEAARIKPWVQSCSDETLDDITECSVERKTINPDCGQSICQIGRM